MHVFKQDHPVSQFLPYVHFWSCLVGYTFSTQPSNLNLCFSISPCLVQRLKMKSEFGLSRVFLGHASKSMAMYSTWRMCHFLDIQQYAGIFLKSLYIFVIHILLFWYYNCLIFATFLIYFFRKPRYSAVAFGDFSPSILHKKNVYTGKTKN